MKIVKIIKWVGSINILLFYHIMGNDQIPISKKDLEAKQNASFLK
jgi:hypothetical protein